MQYEILEVTDTFVYGRISIADTVDIDNACQRALDKQGTETGEVGEEDQGIDEQARKSSITWLRKSKKVRERVDAFVSEINDEYFHEDISDLAWEYQVTLYDDTDDHYDWHQDRYEDDEDDQFHRHLSLSICLSPSEFYEGAEFFIKDGSEQNVRVFKMKYGEFIIFPSLKEHKVNALREGSRLSLVVWYGHNL